MVSHLFISICFLITYFSSDFIFICLSLEIKTEQAVGTCSVFKINYQAAAKYGNEVPKAASLASTWSEVN